MQLIHETASPNGARHVLISTLISGPGIRTETTPHASSERNGLVIPRLPRDPPQDSYHIGSTPPSQGFRTVSIKSGGPRPIRALCGAFIPGSAISGRPAMDGISSREPVCDVGLRRPCTCGSKGLSAGRTFPCGSATDRGRGAGASPPWSDCWRPVSAPCGPIAPRWC